MVSDSLCLTSFINVEFKVFGSNWAAALQGTMSVTTEKVGHRSSMEGICGGKKGLETS